MSEEKIPAFNDVQGWIDYVKQKLGVTPQVVDLTPPPSQKLAAKDKSAFKPEIFNPLTPDYYQPYVSTLAHLLHSRRIGLPNYMMMDTFLSFYKPFNTVVDCLREPKTLWQKVIADLVSSKDFPKVNSITANSVELSIAAAFNFLSRMFQNTRINAKLADSLSYINDPRQHDELRKHLGQEVLPYSLTMALNAAEFFMKHADEYSRYLFNEIQRLSEEQQALNGLLAQLPGGQGFTHEALSVLHYLQSPDDFRRKVKLLNDLLKSFKFYTASVSTAMQREVIESTYGGVSGVTVLRDLKQIQDLAVQELALPSSLMALRILSQQATVKQRAVSIQPVVFVDKSGSMAEKLSFYEETAKISAASGLALALYRKLNADIYLFDVEVHKVAPRDIIKTLLTIQADSGTRIEEVLNTIKTLPTSRQYVVISDGIDEVSEDLAAAVAKTHKVTFCILPPSWKPNWLRHFKTVEVKKLEDLLPSRLLRG